jgi:glucan phosphoethanolaminetransferase (alkaline phosphatase superfamily)
MDALVYIFFSVFISATIALIFCQIQIARKKKISSATFLAGLFTATIIASIWTAFVQDGMTSLTYHYWKTERTGFGIPTIIWFIFFICIFPASGIVIWIQKKKQQSILPVVSASGLLVLLCALVSPNLKTVSSFSPTNACINNLRIIDAAKNQWALENNKTTNDTPTWENIQPYIGSATRNKIPRCPEGGIYIIGSIGQSPTCSIEGHTLQ